MYAKGVLRGRSVEVGSAQFSSAKGPEMKLNTFAGWVGYGLALLAVTTMGLFLVAVGSGYDALAVLAGSVCVVAVAGAMGLVGGVVKHDHRLHRNTPRLL